MMVSIIIPLYNAEKYIEKTINSCLNQTYKNVEIIVIDDCSTDRSFVIVSQRYHNNKTVKAFSNKENKGFIKTLNKGIEISKGDYILPLGNDDILESKHIELMLIHIQKKDYSFVYCASNYIDEFDNCIGMSNTMDINNNYTLLAKRNIINSCGLLINREKICMVGGYPEIEGCPNYGEWYLWLLLLSIGFIGYVKEIKTKYRIHQDNLTKTFLRQDNIKDTMKYNLMCMKYGYHIINHNLRKSILFYYNYCMYIIKMYFHIYIKRG